MYIPQIADAAYQLLNERDVISTAESFKSWNTCQANTTCKIVSWVGIGLAALLALWIIFALVGVLCMGLECCAAMCCCMRGCCASDGRRRLDQTQGYYPQAGYSGYRGAEDPMMYEQPSSYKEYAHVGNAPSNDKYSGFGNDHDYEMNRMNNRY